MIELYYASLDATFFNPWLAAAETEQEDEGIAIEDLLEQLCADREWAEISDGLTIPEWATSAHRRVADDRPQERRRVCG